MHRWKQRYEEFGYDGLFDRRWGRASPKRVPLTTVEAVLRLYRERYFDFNVSHFHEVLQTEHQIALSYSWVKTALQTAGLVAKTRKRGLHRQRRPRRPLPGMLLHIDASTHAWLSAAGSGLTVRAVHEASGNSFEAVTDARGDHRIPARVGTYRLTAELAGFAPVMRTVTLVVGQEAVVNLQRGASAVQESVTVTGEAPLLDVTQSSLGGNIDPRQLQELPVNGRASVDLVMLAPGARVNAVSSDSPTDAGATGPSSGRAERTCYGSP